MEKKRDPFFISSKKQNKSQDPFFMTSKKQNKCQNEDTEQRSEKITQSKNKRDNVDKKHDKFDKNRNGLEEKQDKQPFDKKAYRLKKYSKKYKLEQWEEQRKKTMLHRYQKDLKDLPTIGTYKPISFDEDTTDSNNEFGKYVRHPDIIEKALNDAVGKETRKDPYHKAKEQFRKIKQEKAEKQKGVERVKEERKQKLQEYKKKKHERFKKLSKKTKKGQPVMTGRLELLLEKIQQG